jgi:hypothetical protein
MRCIFISLCFVLTNLSSSLPITTNNQFFHYQQVRSVQSNNSNNNLVNLNVSSNICSRQSVNIDKPVDETGVQHNTSTAIIIPFKSSWQQNIVTNNDDLTSLNIIQITFTIPYTITNESILNETVFITDVKHNQLLATLTNICFNESSFFVNYSTIQSLPQTICLYLLLNLTSSMTLREIIFCRTIENLYNSTSSSDNTNTETNATAGPSGIFILSQGIIIFIMMFIIYAVHTAREKNLVNRVSQRVVRSRPYIIICGHKTVSHTSSDDVEATRKSATTLQAGLNLLRFNLHLTALPNQQVTAAIEEQVLAANDLTSTLNDRGVTKPCINRDLIDVKELTKRISIANQNSTTAELHS